MDIFPQADLFRHRRQLLLVGTDTAIAVLLLYLLPLSTGAEGDASILTWVFVPIIILASFVCGLYGAEILVFASYLRRSLGAGLLAGLLLLPFIHRASIWLVFGLIAFLLSQILARRLFIYFVTHPAFRRNVLVLGSGKKAETIAKLIENSSGYHFSGYIGATNEPVNVAPELLVGQMHEIVDLARKYRASAIVIALSERRGTLAVNRLVTCKLMGRRIFDYPEFFEMLTGKIPVEEINPSWLVQGSSFYITPVVRLVKRVIDIVLASALLVVTLPIILIVALLIKLTSPGPVFYFQQRVGMHGKPFVIYKLRSMTIDAERSKAQWARQNDPRVTRIGGFMRKTRIDELPQLINVLKGDMSFIGPRPERPELVAEIAKVVPYYHERHAVKPGITGWAQIMYPYGASIGDALEKLRYDLYYIKNLSFFLEMIIAIETIQVVVFRKGSR